jgi:hypothetical protein
LRTKATEFSLVLDHISEVSKAPCSMQYCSVDEDTKLITHPLDEDVTKLREFMRKWMQWIRILGTIKICEN